MPLTRCEVNGKSGWKWGSSGKCYTGEGGKRRAIQQATAIVEAIKRRGGKAEKITEEKSK